MLDIEPVHIGLLHKKVTKHNVVADWYLLGSGKEFITTKLYKIFFSSFGKSSWACPLKHEVFYFADCFQETIPYNGNTAPLRGTDCDTSKEVKGIINHQDHLKKLSPRIAFPAILPVAWTGHKRASC